MLQQNCEKKIVFGKIEVIADEIFVLHTIQNQNEKVSNEKYFRN
jgi:hypothetical protein